VGKASRSADPVTPVAPAAHGWPLDALETFTAALAKTANRDPGLLNAVRCDRALLLGQLGQSKRARADLERIYALDPTYEDVKDRLAATPCA